MRKAKPRKRIILPDPKYNDTMVTKFVNNIMLTGKKSIAFDLFYEAVDIVSQKTGEDGLEVWKKALANVTPSVEVRSRRVGGATFQIPSEVRPERKLALAIKWILTYSRDKAGKSMAEKLAGELMSAANNEGSAVKKKEDVHRMAEANKAFAHFRW